MNDIEELIKELNNPPEMHEGFLNNGACKICGCNFDKFKLIAQLIHMQNTALKNCFKYLAIGTEEGPLPIGCQVDLVMGQANIIAKKILE